MQRKEGANVLNSVHGLVLRLLCLLFTGPFLGGWAKMWVRGICMIGKVKDMLIGED